MFLFISYIINLAFFLPVAYTARRVKKEMKQNIHGRSEYIALGRLLSEQGDSLELFASNHEDEGLLLSFLAKLDEENEASK